ncbi:MAG: glycosyltransferase family 2 protein [Candidatus Omnitrophica bacterium]|nr:glycosyltransferase family 2 protein [Candidatus Omnitrophota bacterium]
MPKPLVSVIIVNYNGRKWLQDCLASLKQSTYENTEIILVDNASSDDSVQFTSNAFPQCIIIQNKKNLGFAEGNNVAVRQAKGEYVFFLSNDTRIECDCISKLVEALESNSCAGACQAKVLVMSEPNILERRGAYLSKYMFLVYDNLLSRDDKSLCKPFEIFSLNGAAIFFRKSVLDEIGLFDSDYFAYFEETDLCWRSWLAGYTALFIPDAVVYHAGSKTSKTFPSSFRYYHPFKNRIATIIKNLEMRNLIWMLPLHLFLCFGIIIALAFKLRFSQSFAVFRAMLWNVKNFKKTLEKRKEVQTKIRKLSDNELFPKIMRDKSITYFIGLFI